jgi:hypothetical protein
MLAAALIAIEATLTNSAEMTTINGVVVVHVTVPFLL